MTSRLLRRLANRLGWTVQGLLRRDEGMVTAEYAVGILAACAFAAVMLKVVTGADVLHALTRLVTSALETKR
jgi:hypothetical protein